MRLAPPQISRRGFMALLGSTAVVRTAGWPDKAQAASHSAATPYAPPSMMKATNGEYLDKYKDSLVAFIKMIEDYPDGPTKDRLYDTSVTVEDAENVSEVYALAAGSRPTPFSNGTSTQTVLSPSYGDLTNLNAALPNVGPTMEFIRGETTSLWLENTLQVCGYNPKPSEVGMGKLGFTPHNYEYTNLHTHGLHVEPNAPSDDVLVTVKSRSSSDEHGHAGHGAHMEQITAQDPTTFPNYYDIRDDHPVGTFWYHPHMHGTVAAQVGPGMAGALLMRSGAGQVDFDEILEQNCNIMKPNPAGTTQEEQWGDERVIVIQGFQSLYEVSGSVDFPFDGAFVADALYRGSLKTNVCFGEMADGETLIGDPISTSSSSGGQELWVNGTYQPTLTMKKGEILRFRMINATNGQMIIPKIKATGDNQTLPGVYAIGVDGITLLPISSDDVPVDLPISLTTPAVAAEAANYTDSTPYFEIDYGQTDQSSPKYWTTAEIINMAPAQRLDILVKAPDAPGKYELFGAARDEAPTVVGDTNSVNTSLILKIEVVDEERASNVPQSIPTMSLFDNSQLSTGTIQRPPMTPSANAAPQATQSQWFGYVGDANMKTVGKFQVNGTTFDANLDDGAQVVLTLDQLTAWELYSADGPHIFHIHINSFAVFGRYDVDANSGGSDTWSWPSAAQGNWPTPSKTLPYLMPIWRDTVYFDSAAGKDTQKDMAMAGTRVLATSYQKDYTGEFVFHCHSLYHEDNGMMQTVQIIPSA